MLCADGCVAAGRKAGPLAAPLEARILLPREAAARLAPAPPIWLELLRRFDLTPYLQRFSARWAAIAAAAIFLGIVSLAATREPLTFARYRTEVIEASWQANPHLEFRSTEPAEIKQWFKSRGFLLEEIIPKAITNAQVQGCRLIEWRGHRVAMLCLFEEGRGYHFFIADGLGVEYLPWEDKPDFEDVGSWKRSWKTIAWSAGDRTFVLAGMKYPEFTKRVYKDGAWQLSTL